MSRDLVNEQIPFPQVLVIGPNGEQLGIMKRYEALKKSEEYGLDLLCVSSAARPAVCKILDYGKYHFEQQKKERANERKKKVSSDPGKQVRFTPMTSDHDLEIKANMCKKFLEKGLKIKVSIFLRGRMKTKTEMVDGVMSRFLEMLKDYGAPEKKPVQDGKYYSCVINPVSKK